MTKIIFAASWDSSLKIATSAVAVLLCGVSAMAVRDMLRVSFSRAPLGFIAMIVAALIGPIVFGYCFLEHPRGYYAENGNLCVDRPVSAYKIPLVSIKRASLLQPPFTGNMSRVCGVGGLFGYFGVYEQPQIGRFKMFATRNGNYVFLETDDGNYVLTPDSPRELLSYLGGQKIQIVERPS